MKILVVEDEKRIADNLKKGLELEGFIADTVNNGQDGYDYAVSENYNLIILDRMLPKLDGLELCKNLRRDGIVTPILMLTAKGEVQDRIAGLNAGADDYLPKPFAFEELISRVKALLRRSPQLKVTNLQVADLILNSDRYTVTRSNKEINLTHHEYNLLRFLMNHPNIIHNKEKIIDSVWHFDSNILPNTVEATIKNLRKKIEKTFPNLPPIIYTFRGLGYQLKTHV